MNYLHIRGDGVLTITTNGKILANGGDASRQHAESGGAGSGGSHPLGGWKHIHRLTLVSRVEWANRHACRWWTDCH